MVAVPLGVEAQFPRGLLAAPPRRDTRGTGSCAIETRPISFGRFDPEAGADVDAVGQVIYTCDNQAKKIRIDISEGLSNSFDRRMHLDAGAYELFYNIYVDATHRTVWGDGVLGTDVYYENNPPNGTRVTVPAYGHIPGRQTQEVPPGLYIDVVTVRIQF